MVEPWMSGSLAEVPPAIRTLLHSLEHVQHDIRHWTEGFSTEEIWARPHGLASIGFQIRHIAGSTERLFTYAEGKLLDETQLAALKTESDPGEPLDMLMSQLDGVFSHVASRARELDPATLDAPRGVGRMQLPATLIGLLVHISEHNMRHVGQLIVTARLLRQIGR